LLFFDSDSWQTFFLNHTGLVTDKTIIFVKPPGFENWTVPTSARNHRNIPLPLPIAFAASFKKIFLFFAGFQPILVW